MTLLNLGVEFDVSKPSLKKFLQFHLNFHQLKTLNLSAGEHKSDELTKLNPQQTVPTVVDDDGFVMSESRAIITYLVDSLSPDNTLYPADIKARFTINHRLYYDATTFTPRVRDAIVSARYSGNVTANLKFSFKSTVTGGS